MQSSHCDIQVVWYVACLGSHSLTQFLRQLLLYIRSEQKSKLIVNLIKEKKKKKKDDRMKEKNKERNKMRKKYYAHELNAIYPIQTPNKSSHFTTYVK